MINFRHAAIDEEALYYPGRINRDIVAKINQLLLSYNCCPTSISASLALPSLARRIHHSLFILQVLVLCGFHNIYKIIYQL